jgi:p38 MAP kinase
MADFVKLSIFGTVSPAFFSPAGCGLTHRQVFEVTTRYVDLQPVGMGAFGLVWSVDRSFEPAGSCL